MPAGAKIGSRNPMVHLQRSLLYQQQLAPPSNKVQKKSWKVGNDGKTSYVCISISIFYLNISIYHPGINYLCFLGVNILDPDQALILIQMSPLMSIDGATNDRVCEMPVLKIIPPYLAIPKMEDVANTFYSIDIKCYMSLLTHTP